MPKDNSTTFEKISDRAWRQWDKLFPKMHKYQRAGEELFSNVLKVAEKGGDQREINQGYSYLVSFLLGIGHDGQADMLLREWIARFPNSNEARVSAARYLWHNRWQAKKALVQIKKVKFPKKPLSGDVDVYYNALELKGDLLLADRKKAEARKQMQILADFIESKFDEIKFFFELGFVGRMIEQGLALQDCKRYLLTLRRREQVGHDQITTQKLLRKVDQKLRKQKH